MAPLRRANLSVPSEHWLASHLCVTFWSLKYFKNSKKKNIYIYIYDSLKDQVTVNIFLGNKVFLIKVCTLRIFLDTVLLHT